VIHYREQRKPTNTGLLATECLTNSALVVRGSNAQRECSLSLDPGATTLILFPDEHARPLTDFVTNQPITLVVPDGNWRQASKVRTRIPQLAGATLVGLPEGPPSAYRLRHEAQVGGLATLEAIARALGVLDGAAIQDALERVLRIMVERTLWARGALRDDELTDGLPVGAVRHDPLSGTERTPA
jgi:DTW domain-containing protein